MSPAPIKAMIAEAATSHAAAHLSLVPQAALRSRRFTASHRRSTT